MKPWIYAGVFLGCVSGLLLGTVLADEITWDGLQGSGMRPEIMAYKTVGDVRLSVHVYATEKTNEVRRPAVLMIHGGGWANPGPWHFAPHCRYFAQRGMVAVNVEYRLVKEGGPLRVGDCIADCRDALRFVRTHAEALGVDPDRIVAAGDSAGGHLAAALALLPDPEEGKPGAVSSMPNALMLLNPVLDLAALTWIEKHFVIAPGPDTPPEETWKDRAGRFSPVAFVRKGLPPTLLMHGDRDEVVPIEQADRFAKLMKSSGNKIEFKQMKGWGHAFALAACGTEPQIVESIQMMDTFLAGLKYLEGKPLIAGEWRPPEYHALFSGKERLAPHVQARSHDMRFWPFLDGQWLGIVNDPDGRTWLSFSTHSGIQHSQFFRYDPAKDRVDHVADLGQACGEKLTGYPPQDKIHGEMFVEGDYVLAGTCEGHMLPGNPYRGGYWLKIHRQTGEVTNLGKSISEDGLLCVGYDPVHKRLYGHSNRKGWLTRLDLDSGKEQFLGIPWQDVLDDWEASKQPGKPKEIWPRGLTLMITKAGRVFGVKPGPGTFWGYDPGTGQITTFRVEMPLPKELQALKDAGKAPDDETLRQWQNSPFHLTLWNEKDQCFYLIRSFDQMLCRFYPPEGKRAARLELLHELGLKERRYNARPASCTLVIAGRKVYYTPHTGWGGITHLTSYDLDKRSFADHGPIVVEGDRRVNECHAMVVAPDGKLHLAAFVFSKEGSGDPVTSWAMRDKYPFHSRLVIIDPATDLDSCLGAGK